MAHAEYPVHMYKRKNRRASRDMFFLVGMRQVMLSIHVETYNHRYNKHKIHYIGVDEVAYILVHQP